MEETKEWSENFTEEVYREWKENYSEVETGIKTFYTPVTENPPLMIIGYNPGGDKASFQKDKQRFENGDFSNPEKSELLTKEYPLARKFRNKIFQDHTNILEEAVKFDLIFFRSKKASYLKDQLGEDYQEVLDYCYDRSEEVIEKLQPETILLYGISTYDKFQENFQEDFKQLETVKSSSNNRRIFCKGEWRDIKIFGIIHPSGAYPSNEELGTVQEFLFSKLS